jgi:Protein of unknown function (DUF3604)
VTLGTLGTFSIQPHTAPAGETVSLRFRYLVGAAGVQRGGGIRVQLPDGWHDFGANTAKGVHASVPAASDYVAGSCSKPAAGLAVEVEGESVRLNKQLRTGLDGRTSRYVYVVRAIVTGEPLEAGDTVDVLFGPPGSAGFRAGFYAEGPEPILVAVDAIGDGAYHPVDPAIAPTIEIHDRGPAELVAVAPSLVKVGEDVPLRIVCLDAYGNLCRAVRGDIKINAPEAAAVGEAQQLGQLGSWVARFRLTKPGPARFAVELGSGLVGTSNPVLAAVDAPERRLFWGDLHSHSAWSFDGIGHRPFEYARDAALLDFYALTDHAERWANDTWSSVLEEVARFNEPGSFVTLAAYEATFGGPYGHHNVYFRGDGGPVLASEEGTLLDLYGVVQSSEALLVPHHPGISFSGVPTGAIPGNTSPNPDWNYHNPRLRRLIEIYSGHGQSEQYDVSHPLSYEACRFDYITSRSVEGPYYVQDAWRQELQLGVVAGSDDHRGQPGRGEFGLTAVLATDLTRDAVFDAMAERRVYATTGARMVLDFGVEGVPMGGRVPFRDSIAGTVTILGTGTLEVVELVVIDTSTGRTDVLRTWRPADAEFATDWHDGEPPRRGLYYVRARQAERYRDRAVMAWSSPVWIS